MKAENTSMPRPGAEAASRRVPMFDQPPGGGMIGRHRTRSHIGSTAISPSTTDRKHPFGRVRPHSNPQTRRAPQLILAEVVHRAQQRQQEQPFGVRGAEEDRKRIRGDQHHRRQCLVVVAQLASCQPPADRSAPGRTRRSRSRRPSTTSPVRTAAPADESSSGTPGRTRCSVETGTWNRRVNE